MNIETRNDGEDFIITIEDASKNFSFELSIVTRGENQTWIDYTNSNGEQYNLLTVEENGQVIREIPELE